MKPFVIKNPNKIYTKEQLQADSPYPLFDDFHIGEDPKKLEIQQKYQKSKTKNILDYVPLEQKFIAYLPEYVQVFANKILIGPNDDVQIEMVLTDKVIAAIQMKHSIKHKLSNKEIKDILKKDLADFYKKFGAKRAIQAL